MEHINKKKNGILKYVLSKEKIKHLNKHKKLNKFNKKIAIQVHVYYPDLLDEIYENIQHMPYEYDLYISTDTDEKMDIIKKYFKNKNIKNVSIEKVKNQGRDILPFILQLKPRIKDYSYVCHLHTKKSKYADFGDDWRRYLYQNLFGNKENLETIFYIFEKHKNIGIIYPKTYHTIENNMEIGSNKELLDDLCNRLHIENTFRNIFPSGSMFWIRGELLKQLFDVVDKSDFQKESGQIDGTFAHAIERVFVVLAEQNKYKYLQIINEIK